MIVSPYVLMFIWLLLISLVTYTSRKFENLFYYLTFVILTAMAAFRFAQSTDLPAYAFSYWLAPTTLDFDNPFYSNQIHGELGWKIFLNLCRMAGIKFSFVIAGISIFQMLLLNRAIRNHSENKVFSLLLLYPTIYLTMLLSTIRQGIVICVFLGFMFDQLVDRKYFRYTFLVLILSTIHSSALVLLLGLFVRRISLKNAFPCLIVSAIIGIIGLVTKSSYALLASTGSVSFSELDIPSIAFRIGELLIIIFLFRLYKNNNTVSDDSILAIMLNLYIIGICVYLMSVGITLAERVPVPLLSLEIILIPNMLRGIPHKDSFPYLCIVLAIACMMIPHNINMYIVTGYYQSDVNVLNYPYISVFDQDSALLYRSNDPYLEYEFLAEGI